MKAKAGDVFCVWNSGLNKYTACQITGMSHEFKSEQAVHLALDWTGDKPMTEEEMHKAKPLYLDFMFHMGEISLVNVTPEVPADYIYVGNMPPLAKNSSNAYGNWDNGYIVYLQMKWHEIPKDKRDEFKAAAKSRDTVMLSGSEIKVCTHKVYDDNISFEDAGELKALPCLTELVCSHWHNGLCEYVRSNPFLKRLSLRGGNPAVLDFRGSRLGVLCVDLTGVKELWLNEHVFLEITGSAPKDCVIHAGDGGSGHCVEFHGTYLKYPSLNRLSGLYCTGVKEIDFEKLYGDYPELETLRLWGGPGYIRNFASIKKFRRLKEFSTNDLFGFTAEDIPAPEEMENLVWFWMSSLPDDAAKEVRRLYGKRKTQGLDLRIEKARKPEWLAENLDNPFRSWDGEEHIPASSAKRAASQYKKTRKKLLELAGGQEPDVLQSALDAVSEYVRTFNRMRFIETQEREDIYEALCGILDMLQETELDTTALLEHFEKNRDF